MITYPKYDGYSIVNLSNTILKHFGLPVRSSSLSKELTKELQSEKVLLMLLDGVNYVTFKNILNEDDELYKYVNYVYEITTVFPSTTATVLTSISYGVEPGRHGVLGTVMYIREIGMLIHMLDFRPIPSTEDKRDSILDLGFNINSILNLGKTIFQEISELGIRIRTYIPKGLNSGISRILYKGSEIIEYSSYIDAIVNAVSSLNEVDKGLMYIYIPYPDQICHKYGYSLEFKYTISEIIRFCVKFIKKHSTTPITLIVTSDHGLVSVDENDEINFRNYLPKISRHLLIPPYGDCRACQLKLIDNSKIEELLNSDDIQYLKKYFIVYTHDELINSGLLGFTSKENESRVGDLILISKSSKYLYYNYIPSEKERQKMKAHHGGLLYEEMSIPLMIVTL